MRFLFILLLAVMTSASTLAQLPVTKVYAFDFQRRDTAFTFSNPQYLTAFNPYGYNNQPSFIDDHVLMMAVQYPDMPQPDIFSFDLRQKTQSRVTRTRSGEYSPKPIGDGTFFSAVRQEYIGRDTFIRLWRFPTNRIDNGQPVFQYLNGTGYYEWLNSSNLALFLVGNPNQLAITRVGSEKPVVVAENVGRSFHRLPNGNLAYVYKGDTPSSPWVVAEQNLYRLNEPGRIITETLPNAEDFTVLADGSFIMGAGSKLFHFDPIRSSNWREIVDLRFYGIRNISRITTNGKGVLALVSE
ncbi:MAG: hypothetical protein AAF828_03590 [Bacteroidota bacterium]